METNPAKNSTQKYIAKLFYKKSNLWRFFWVSVVLFFSYQMFWVVYPYIVGNEDTDFLFTKQTLWHLDFYMNSLYLHIYSSLFVLLAGATQFSRTLMFKYSVFHRNIGKMYVIIVLLVSAPSGMIMSFFANGNILSRIGFIILTTLWWLTTYLAYSNIRKKKILVHSNFMIRSYALTFSAVTLRLYQFIIKYTYPELQIFYSKELYIVLSFMSWIPNLLLAEYLIRNGLSQKIMKKDNVV
jgi:hypothetical protein